MNENNSTSQQKKEEISISYVMTQEEYYKCLYNSKSFKPKGQRLIIQSVIFVLAAGAFLYAYFFTDSQYNSYNLFFGIFCMVMIPLLWVVPRLHLRSTSKMMADGKTIQAVIASDEIRIGSGAGAWSIPLDNTAELQEFDGILMITDAEGRGFSIPERAAGKENYAQIKAILSNGTLRL